MSVSKKKDTSKSELYELYKRGQLTLMILLMKICEEKKYDRIMQGYKVSKNHLDRLGDIVSRLFISCHKI